jgi:ubiquinone/menaquinone biosynthesis C-methylase UbiE
LTNVEPVKGTATDPKLPAGGVDLILMVDVYHEFEFPFEMTEKMVAALKPGGRLVFVEFRMEDDKVAIKLVHKMSERQVMKEAAVFRSWSTRRRWARCRGSTSSSSPRRGRRSDRSPARVPRGAAGAARGGVGRTRTRR